MRLPSPVLRRATPQDADFQFRLFASVHGEEFNAPGWDATQRQALLALQYRMRAHGYATQFPQATTSIALLQGVPAGELIVAEEPSALHIVDVAALPTYEIDGVSRSTAGLGRYLIASVLNEAVRSGRPALAHVVKHNRAMKLWLRMGFVVSGEDEIYASIIWRPPAAGATPLP